MTDLPLDGAVLAGFDGAWVVDLWGGFADVAHRRPWRRDSIVMPYSVAVRGGLPCPPRRSTTNPAVVNSESWRRAEPGDRLENALRAVLELPPVRGPGPPRMSARG